MTKPESSSTAALVVAPTSTVGVSATACTTTAWLSENAVDTGVTPLVSSDVPLIDTVKFWSRSSASVIDSEASTVSTLLAFAPEIVTVPVAMLTFVVTPARLVPNDSACALTGRPVNVIDSPCEPSVSAIDSPRRAPSGITRSGSETALELLFSCTIVPALASTGVSLTAATVMSMYVVAIAIRVSRSPAVPAAALLLGASSSSGDIVVLPYSVAFSVEIASTLMPFVPVSTPDHCARGVNVTPPARNPSSAASRSAGVAPAAVTV